MFGIIPLSFYVKPSYSLSLHRCQVCILQGLKQIQFKWQEQSTVETALLAKWQQVTASCCKNNKIIYTQLLLVYNHSSALSQGQNEVKLYLWSQCSQCSKTCSLWFFQCQCSLFPLSWFEMCRSAIGSFLSFSESVNKSDKWGTVLSTQKLSEVTSIKKDNICKNYFFFQKYF